SGAAASGVTERTKATAASHVGAYAITAAGATAGDYTIAFLDGTLTVTRAPLTIQADDQSMTFGSVVPPLTATFLGLVNGDTSSVVTGLQLSTSATSTSLAGSYAIVPAGGTAGDYSLTYVNGTLTVPSTPPAVGGINPSGAAVRGNEVLFAAQFAADGTSGGHTAVWDWGDGTRSPGTVNEDAASAPLAGGSVTGSHVYTATGTYTVTLTVANSHGQSSSVSLPLVLMATALAADPFDPTTTDLYVGGTQGNDRIVIKPVCADDSEDD